MLFVKYVEFVVRRKNFIVPLQTRIWLLVIICKVLKVGPLSFVRMEAAFFNFTLLLYKFFHLSHLPHVTSDKDD